MKRDEILKEMKRRGKRITEQRKILLDIILKNPHNSCKEIYYEAVKKDSSIGIATVYRMMNMLEELGAINRFYSCPVNMNPDAAADIDKGISIVNGKALTDHERDRLYDDMKSLLADRGILENKDQKFAATIVVNS